MDLERIACGNCGAALDVPDGVQFVTCRHCGSSLKVARTNDIAFTEVLETLKEQSARIADNTDVIRLQNEIALLDQEWEQRSASLMVHGQHGRVSTPDKSTAMAMGITGIIGAGIWTAIAAATFPLMILFGIVVGGIMLLGSYAGYEKACRYESLKAKHDQKRRSLLSRLRSLEGR
jgi:hypothetical protein